MTDTDALWAAVLAAPEDDAPRLIYADWLDEHGDPDGAAFIRAQVHCFRNPRCKHVTVDKYLPKHKRSRCPTCQARETHRTLATQRLLRKLDRGGAIEGIVPTSVWRLSTSEAAGTTTVNPISTTPTGGNYSFVYRRGFLSEVVCGLTFFWAYAKELALAPVTEVFLDGVGPTHGSLLSHGHGQSHYLWYRYENDIRIDEVIGLGRAGTLPKTVFDVLESCCRAHPEWHAAFGRDRNDDVNTIGFQNSPTAAAKALSLSLAELLKRVREGKIRELR